MLLANGTWLHSQAWTRPILPEAITTPEHDKFCRRGGVKKKAFFRPRGSLVHDFLGNSRMFPCFSQFSGLFFHEFLGVLFLHGLLSLQD